MTEIKSNYLAKNNIDEIKLSQLFFMAAAYGYDLAITLTPIHKHDPEVVIDPENNTMRMVCKDCGKIVLESELEPESCS